MLLFLKCFFSILVISLTFNYHVANSFFFHVYCNIQPCFEDFILAISFNFQKYFIVLDKLFFLGVYSMMGTIVLECL